MASRDKAEPAPSAGGRPAQKPVPTRGRVRIIALVDALKLPVPEPGALSSSPALLKAGG
jgi:hypothetical protein